MADTPKPGGLAHKQTPRLVPFSLPIVVSQRLDDLCAILNSDGTVGTIYRKDLVAALIALAPEDLDALETAIQDYRKLKVRDLLVGGAKVFELREVKPGRRTAP